MLQDINSVIDVEVVELQLVDGKSPVYEFQNQITVSWYVKSTVNKWLIIQISNLNHKNLVKVYGITLSPLRIVLELVQGGASLATLLESHKDFSMQWKLKVAIDVATGMK